MNSSDRWSREVWADRDLTDRLRADLLDLHITTDGTYAYDSAFISTVAGGLVIPGELADGPADDGFYPPPGHGFPGVDR